MVNRQLKQRRSGYWTIVSCLAGIIVFAGCKPSTVSVKRKPDSESSVAQMQATQYSKIGSQKVDYVFEVPLKWAEQSELETEIRSNSESVVAKFKTLKRVELKCDRAGIRWLSEFVESERESWSPQLAANLANSLGSYFAECVHCTVGGQWYRTEDDIELKVDSEHSVFPFKLFREHIEHGSSHSIESRFAALDSILESSNARSSN